MTLTEITTQGDRIEDEEEEIVEEVEEEEEIVPMDSLDTMDTTSKCHTEAGMERIMNNQLDSTNVGTSSKNRLRNSFISNQLDSTNIGTSFHLIVGQKAYIYVYARIYMYIYNQLDSTNRGTSSKNRLRNSFISNRLDSINIGTSSKNS